MIVEQVWTGNAYRNFNYVIVCPDTGEALAIDPLDHEKCLTAAEKNGWKITQILNTHEHGDHTGGNKAMVAATGAKLLAHKNAKDSIPGIDVGLSAGDVVKVGRVELESLDTPGHTMSHVCLLSHTDQPALICGDTMFNAGAGNCHNGGHPAELYHTFTGQIAKLPDDTQIYPGHDYLTNNLEFTLSREPNNTAAKAMLDKLQDTHDPDNATITTLGQEKEINTFFRLHNPEIIETLRGEFPELSPDPEPMEIFLKLRELRNSW